MIFALVNRDAERRMRSDLGMSLSLRCEALCRLQSEELVRIGDQRGYHVDPVSTADLHEVIYLHVKLEGVAPCEAVLRGDTAWDGGILATLPGATSGTLESDLRSARPPEPGTSP